MSTRARRSSARCRRTSRPTSTRSSSRARSTSSTRVRARAPMSRCAHCTTKPATRSPRASRSTTSARESRRPPCAAHSSATSPSARRRASTSASRAQGPCRLEQLLSDVLRWSSRPRSRSPIRGLSVGCPTVRGMRRSAAICAPVLIAATLIACGGDDNGSGGSLDRDALEQDISQRIANATNQPAPNVNCPSDLPATEGATIRCRVEVPGASYGVTVTVTDTSGDSGAVRRAGRRAVAPAPAGSAPAERPDAAPLGRARRSAAHSAPRVHSARRRRPRAPSRLG